MVKLADLVHIANNAKTNAQKNAVGEEVKKLIRGRKACYPEKEFFTKDEFPCWLYHVFDVLVAGVWLCCGVGLGAPRAIFERAGRATQET